MVRYFKINDPYRLLTLFLFILLTRTGAILFGFPYSQLHSDLFQSVNEESVHTIFGWFCVLLNFISSDPTIISVVISSILITLQAFIINTIFIRSKVFNQNTYIPAAIYVMLFSLSPEYILLSPQLCAITFILIGINHMFFHLQYRGSEENIFNTGVMFGLATLFEPSSFVFVFLKFR